MYQPRIKQVESEMAKVLASLSDNLKTLRTGRASPALVEDILVPFYGTPTPLKHVGSISAPDPNLIVVSPWDKSILVDIEGTLRTSDLGLNPINDGTVVRIAIPPMTEERRKELAKRLHQMAEEVRVALRGLRRDAWDEIQDMEKEGEISEDDRYAAEKELNKLIDDFHQKVDQAISAKDKEIMTV